VKKLTDVERATILAALRFWQTTSQFARTQDPIATDEGRLVPLYDAEIDVLCETLNYAEKIALPDVLDDWIA